MNKNERDSCAGRSQHIDVRFFFVKDIHDEGELKLEYCPTNKIYY